MKDFRDFRKIVESYKNKALNINEDLSPRIAITINGLKGNIKKLQDSLEKAGGGIQFIFDLEGEETADEQYKGNTIIFSYMDDVLEPNDIKGYVFKSAVAAAKRFTQDSKNGNDEIYKEAEKLKMTSGKPFVYSAKLVK